MYRGGKLLLSNRNLGNIFTSVSRGVCNDVSVNIFYLTYIHRKPIGKGNFYDSLCFP